MIVIDLPAEAGVAAEAEVVTDIEIIDDRGIGVAVEAVAEIATAIVNLRLIADTAPQEAHLALHTTTISHLHLILAP